MLLGLCSNPPITCVVLGEEGGFRDNSHSVCSGLLAGTYTKPTMKVARGVWTRAYISCPSLSAWTIVGFSQADFWIRTATQWLADILCKKKEVHSSIYVLLGGGVRCGVGFLEHDNRD